MKALHILTGGNVGGIEKLCQDYVVNSKLNNTLLFFISGGQIYDEVVEKGIPTIDLWRQSKSHIIRIKKLLRLCGNDAYQTVIIHHASPITHFASLLIKKKYPKIRIVTYAHGNAEDMYRKKDKIGLRIRKAIISRSLKSADKVIAISKSVKKSLNECMGIELDKITVIYNGVDTEQFKRLPNNNKSNNRLIYIGRLIKEKGVDNIIQGMPLLEDETSNLSIVGDGVERVNLEKLAEKLGVQNRVDFLGRQRNITGLLNDSNIFVHMPEWEEGFGISIIEAMSCGLVCVCADSGAIPEIITDGKNGFIVKKSSPEEWAKKINYVINHYESEEISKIRKNAEERSKDFSIKRFVNKLDDIIQR